MANRILLQTLLRFSDQIKSGAAKVQDVVTDYFNQTGKSVTDEERSIILKEFQDNAPSNVTTLEGVDPRETIMPMGGASDTPFTDTVRAENPGVEIRGDETFGELTEKLGKPKDQGLGSLFPKDQSGFGLDDRGEAATFIKAMRDAGIKNEDIRKVFKDNPPYRKSSSFYGQDKDKMILDLEPGKKAATTLARAADMAADSKVKQELLANLDDDIANYGPDWWKGMGYNDGPMGRESVGNLLESITTDINNGVIDDLIAQGVEEDKAFEIFRFMGKDKLKFDPKAFISKITDELEFNDIKYDMTFWDNYTDEILTRIQKPEPRFADGGLV
jgi:hypothetical protein